MERTSKASFIALSSRKIEMYESFIKAFDIIIRMVKEWDGKKMNKRYIDKINEAINDKVPHVRFSFSTSWRGERENRFKLYFDNRWVESVRGYIDVCESVVYGRNGEQYINEIDFKLDAEKCVVALENDREICLSQAQRLMECIERIDEVIEKYAEMKSYVSKVLEDIPAPLRNSFTINCPVY